MKEVRLVADDLTGALDTAAELTPLAGPMPIFWDGVRPAELPASCAIDSGTREKDPHSAVQALARLAPELANAAIPYKKVDSLLRGHTMAELAACWRLGAWDHCIVAPAFPFHGRVTVGGVQSVRGRDPRVVADVVALLAEAGVEARRGDPSRSLALGVTVFDAETDHDLARVATLGRAARGRVLWCGSAGLAQALAAWRDMPKPPRLSGRVIGLFGSDQDITAQQLHTCGDRWLRLSGQAGDHDRLVGQLGRDGIVMASLAIPAGLSRTGAAERIATVFAGIVKAITRPDVLLVAGGETLRGLCDALGATSLEVRGQFEPGLPHSVMRGGRWDGVTVVSKSGAFGGPTLWRDLLTAHGHAFGDAKPDGASAGKVRA